ncbi:MAG: hypothetical protein CM1200mP40_35710 [Gammaproteobacteria bacterium]|nr:MAG: hypothetical protein CM1200mP40_35710 [Gammaproteobacteria bacterium]
MRTCSLARRQVVLYTPSQGISNCRHDTARDLGLEDHQVQIIAKYRGGGFGNKNQNQDADLIAATLSRRAVFQLCWNIRVVKTG